MHVADLAAALLELASCDAAGMHHLGGPDALSRHDLGILIAKRDGLDDARLPTGLRAGSTLPGALDVRLDSGRPSAICAPHCTVLGSSCSALA